MFPFMSMLKPSMPDLENKLRCSTELDAALAELITKYHAIQPLKNCPG